MPSHISLVEPLPPEWPSWRPILAGVLVCTKSVTRRHAACCSSSHSPAQPGRDPALGRDADHLGHHQPGAAEGLAAEVHEVEVGGQPVDGDVHVHRRDDDPVDQVERADPDRLEHRRADVGGADVAGVPLVAAGHELRVAQPQVVVGDPAAAGHDVEAELERVLVDVLAEVLEPLQAGLRGALRGEDDGLALGLVRRQRGGERRPPRAGRRRARARPPSRAWCRSRSRSGRCGRRRRGSPRPLIGRSVHPALVADRGEADPAGVVGHHLVPVEHVGEELADPLDRLLVGLARRPRRGRRTRRSRPSPRRRRSSRR